mmetsp:Transcript_10809/g.31467  ORF Transcript_10809/g.31467 Transcript_10809/m.31467 type:complete len:213 (+) Transcript_10809:2765-3403(+)
MFRTDLRSEHTQYTGSTTDVQNNLVTEQMTILFDSHFIGSSTDLIFQHFFVYCVMSIRVEIIVLAGAICFTVLVVCGATRVRWFVLLFIVTALVGNLTQKSWRVCFRFPHSVLFFGDKQMRLSLTTFIFDCHSTGSSHPIRYNRRQNRFCRKLWFRFDAIYGGGAQRRRHMIALFYQISGLGLCLRNNLPSLGKRFVVHGRPRNIWCTLSER